MTPGARIAAAIEILDQIQAGAPAERVLTRWARGNRFAGSGDRAVIRDHVYDVLRLRSRAAALGGGTSGRALMIGVLRQQGIEAETLFTGNGHAPAALSASEASAPNAALGKAEGLCLPEWLVPHFEASLGDAAEDTALALQSRAPVTLRVNASKITRAAAQAQLLGEGIETTPNPRADTALTVTAGPRRLRNAPSYLSGFVEVQDAASQAAIDTIAGTGKALDFCAGGGGKGLALAARGWDVTAHDTDAKRMRDLPQRAARGGHEIAICPPQAIGDAGIFDLVFCDAPCSGSGTWRRTPEAKWALTPARLAEVIRVQAQVLEQALAHVGPGGRLVYATCSVLRDENEAQVDGFVARHPDWQVTHQQRWDVDPWGDGFFVAHLSRR